MKWPDVEPVLLKTYALLDTSDHVSGEEVSIAMGRGSSDESTARAFEELDKAGYVSASFSLGFALPFHIQATEKGLQHCAGWPAPGSESVFVAQLLTAIDARANDVAVPEEERGRLNQLGRAAAAVGKDVLTEVVAKAVSP